MGDLSHKPTVFHADTLPRRVPKLMLTFRFGKGEIGLSKTLYQDLLNAKDYRRVAFTSYRGSWYITRVDRAGFWINTVARPKSGVSSAEVHNKPFVLSIMRQLEHTQADVVCIPVAPHQVQAFEIGLSAEEYPYPFYRLIVDQKFLKA